MNDPTQNIVEFIGLRNKHDPRRLPSGALVRAVNVEVDDQKGLISRKGYKQTINSGEITDSFCTIDESRWFIIKAQTLYMMDSSTAMLEISTPIDSKVYWLEIEGEIFLSSGHLIGRDNVVRRWDIPNPDAPKVTVIDGDCPAGIYRVVNTYRDDTGREGGTSFELVLEVGDNSAFIIEPQILTGYTPITYITDTNGSVFYKAGINDLVLNETKNNTSPIDDAQLRSKNFIKDYTPLAFFEGKIYYSQVFEGVSFIWYSQPFWLNLFEYHDDYIAVEGKVNAMVGTDQGLVIATDDEILVYDTNGRLSTIVDYGVPEGTSFDTNDEGVVFIWTHQGLCSLFPFKNMTESKVSVESGQTVHIKHVVDEGFDKVLVFINGNHTDDNRLNRNNLADRDNTRTFIDDLG